MANRKARAYRNELVKRGSQATAMLNNVGRFSAVAFAVCVVALIGVQYARFIGRDVVAYRDLQNTQSDIARLEARRPHQLRDLQRRQDPEGAVPEIHSQLRLVRSNEAIIFVSPAPGAAPTTNP